MILSHPAWTLRQCQNAPGGQRRIEDLSGLCAHGKKSTPVHSHPSDKSYVPYHTLPERKQKASAGNCSSASWQGSNCHSTSQILRVPPSESWPPARRLQGLTPRWHRESLRYDERIYLPSSPFFRPADTLSAFLLLLIFVRLPLPPHAQRQHKLSSAEDYHQTAMDSFSLF